MAKILIVDDEPDFIEIAELCLGPAGYDLISAPDGPAGVARAAADRPDLILMDLTMPGMDGLEATRRIRANPATAGIPVIALTGQAFFNEKSSALAAGCTDVVTKPYTFEALVAAVERHLTDTEG